MNRLSAASQPGSAAAGRPSGKRAEPCGAAAAVSHHAPVGKSESEIIGKIGVNGKTLLGLCLTNSSAYRNPIRNRTFMECRFASKSPPCVAVLVDIAQKRL